MKKLGKKNVEVVKTVEAYGSSSACTQAIIDNDDDCDSKCRGYYSHSDANDDTWSWFYYNWN